MLTAEDCTEVNDNKNVDKPKQQQQPTKTNMDPFCEILTVAEELHTQTLGHLHSHSYLQAIYSSGGVAQRAPTLCCQPFLFS